jgi:hypothetical protein
MYSEIVLHSNSIKEQMRNLIELEKKCNFDIDNAKKKIGICKCKSRCRFGKCKFDLDVLALKIMLCNIKIAQIDIAKTEKK